MKKNRFDQRTWAEIVGNLVTERTSQGDSIKMLIKYNGSEKPSVWLQFATYDPDKKGLANIEEITDWLDSSYSYDLIDDSTGKPAVGEYRRGYSSWQEYIDILLGPTVQQISKSGGRNFTYEVIHGSAV